MSRMPRPWPVFARPKSLVDHLLPGFPHHRLAGQALVVGQRRRIAHPRRVLPRAGHDGHRSALVVHDHLARERHGRRGRGRQRESSHPQPLRLHVRQRPRSHEGAVSSRQAATLLARRARALRRRLRVDGGGRVVCGDASRRDRPERRRRLPGARGCRGAMPTILTGARLSGVDPEDVGGREAVGDNAEDHDGSDGCQATRSGRPRSRRANCPPRGPQARRLRSRRQDPRQGEAERARRPSRLSERLSSGRRHRGTCQRLRFRKEHTARVASAVLVHRVVCVAPARRPADAWTPTGVSQKTRPARCVTRGGIRQIRRSGMYQSKPHLSRRPGSPAGSLPACMRRARDASMSPGRGHCPGAAADNDIACAATLVV